jgi:hypothetical protein
MMPEKLTCEECGRKSKARGYGRVEYAWPTIGNRRGNVEITMIRVTIDCPHCGIRTQDHYPPGRESRSFTSTPGRNR